MPSARYSFAPWLRRGLAAEIAIADDLGEHPEAGPTTRAQIPLDLSIAYIPLAGGPEQAGGTISKLVQMVGPGDVIGLKHEAILRTEPSEGELQFTPSDLAYVEFYEEDLPWRYTPAGPGGAGARRFKLRPWITLWVLEEAEIAALEQSAPPLPPRMRLAAGVPAKALPAPAETWAWAHVQVSRTLAAPEEVPVAIAQAPDHALSRLVCPRRLRSGAAYHAFLVPAFETGRLAGLGEPVGGVPAQKPSWGGAAPATRPDEYPVYYHWTFRTGDSGDFETLVRKLVAHPAGPEFGRRTLDISGLGFGLDKVRSTGTVDLEGALQAPQQAHTEFPDQPGRALAQALESLLDVAENLRRAQSPAAPHPFHDPAAGGAGFAANVPDDPILVPPVYGRWHAGVDRIADAASSADLAWLRELNLDPRSRAAAGLGTQAVQTRQDELVERAWQQVGDLPLANDRLRVAELCAAVGQAVFEKHVGPSGPDRTLTLTEALQRGMGRPGAAGSIYRAIKESRVPLAAQTPAFRRITRPQRSAIKRITGGRTTAALQQDLFPRLDQPAATALSAARPLPEPLAALSFATLGAAVSQAVGALASKVASEPKEIFLALLLDALRSGIKPGQPLSLPTPADLSKAIKMAAPASLSPGVRARVDALADAITGVAEDGDRAARVTLRQDMFVQEIGSDIAGKTVSGVTVVPDVMPVVPAGAPAAQVARGIALADARQFATDLAAFNTELIAGRPLPPPRPALGDASVLATAIHATVQPRTALPQRVLRSLPGLPERTPTASRPLAPVMAHPVFADPTFADLRRLGQDFVIPNFGDIPGNSLTLLEPNDRFIQAFLAGVNHEMARELLWREYPTDQRGTYFRRFWDTRDAAAPQPEDVKPLDTWTGHLGAQSARPGGCLVLVIRGELLRKFPNTVVYAHRARFAADPSQPRELADEVDANLRFPVLQAELDPDIALFGFVLSAADARGRRPGDSGTGPVDPGWFFILKERPGQVRFGLDEPGDGALPSLDSWDDLNWGHLTFPGGATNIGIAANPLVLTGMGAGEDPTAGQWGQSSADMAYILFQDPILYARHAAELLPPDTGGRP